MSKPNALKHGGFSGVEILPWEDPSEFEELRRRLMEEHQPEGPLQEECVNSIASYRWRKRRVRDKRNFDTAAALERVWLRATLFGMSLQPFAGSAVLALPDYPGVSSRLREALAQGWKRLAPGRLPMMVFRMGRAPPPSVRTARRPLDDYVIAPSPSL